MANKLTMNICGEEYTFTAEESATYMQKVGNIVDTKMHEVIGETRCSRNDAAVLAAVNLADELLKAQENNDNLRSQLKSYLDEAAQAKNEISDLKRQIFRLQQNGGQGFQGFNG